MSEERRVISAVVASRRYRGVSAAIVERLATEELSRARTTEEAIKRVKRRLHQSVGAYAPSGKVDVLSDVARLRDALAKDAAAATPMAGGALRSALTDLMARHPSTRERLPSLDRFYHGLWEAIGAAPRSLVDLGCGRAPLALPWMGLASDASYDAIDVDDAQLALVDGFLALVGQPHTVESRDLASVAGPSFPEVEVALLLKLVPVLDRQDTTAAARLLGPLRARHAVISFPARSLGGRGKGMERTYRQRLETLIRQVGPRVTGVTETSIPSELVYVLALADG